MLFLLLILKNGLVLVVGIGIQLWFGVVRRCCKLVIVLRTRGRMLLFWDYSIILVNVLLQILRNGNGVLRIDLHLINLLITAILILYSLQGLRVVIVLLILKVGSVCLWLRYVIVEASLILLRHYWCSGWSYLANWFWPFRNFLETVHISIALFIIISISPDCCLRQSIIILRS